MEPLTQRQRAFGLFGIFFMLPVITIIHALGESLRDFERMLRREDLILPLTPVIVALGRVIGNYWYVPVVLAILLYVNWVSKSCTRVLWWNAILSVAIPAIVLICVYTATAQVAVIQQHAR